MEEGPPPADLLLYWSCKEYHTLPDAGGLRDQPAGELQRMNAARNVYSAVRSWKDMFFGPGGAGTTKTWLRTHKQDWKIVQEWRKVADGL